MSVATKGNLVLFPWYWDVLQCASVSLTNSQWSSLFRHRGLQLKVAKDVKALEYDDQLFEQLD